MNIHNAKYSRVFIRTVNIKVFSSSVCTYKQTQIRLFII